jgi:glyoxylase I family protein
VFLLAIIAVQSKSTKTPMLNKIHHIAIICSDYQKSKKFYTEVLGLEIIREVYRENRQSYKLDLALNGTYVIELFSFPDPPQRVSRPEAAGLRHLAFEVDDLEKVITHLEKFKIEAEPIRIDEFTEKRFTFIADPDNLPIEFYEK